MSKHAEHDISAETLYSLYWDRGLSTYDIAEKLGLSQKTVLYWFDRFGIPRRAPSEGRRLKGYGTEHLIKPRLEPSEELSYILGVCLGDGSVTRCGRQHVIELAAVHREFVESFGKALEKIGLHPFIYIARRGGGERRTLFGVRASSRMFYEWYKSLTLAKIEQILSGNRAYVISFLRGFYESEGSYSKRREGKSRVRIVNADRELAELVARLIQSLGFRVSIRLNKDGRPNRKGSYCIEVLGGEGERMRFLETIKPIIKAPSREPLLRRDEDMGRGTTIGLDS